MVYIAFPPDIDPAETSEWLDSLDAVVDRSGPRRAQFLLSKLEERAQEHELDTPMNVNTPYINTIPAVAQPWFPGDEEVERDIRRWIRWNAAAMVIRANKKADGIGGQQPAGDARRLLAGKQAVGDLDVGRVGQQDLELLGHHAEGDDH